MDSAVRSAINFLLPVKAIIDLDEIVLLGELLDE